MSVDPTTTKYLIEARIETEGIVEKPDVVGAIFGQTEGLLGDELDLRDLQKSGRIGRMEVDIQARKGRSEGFVRIPSSMDQVETAIMAAALETIDRIGPCKAQIRVDKGSDVLALLKSGIKNAVAVEGTNVPPSVQELSKEKTVIAFVDGDRGGDLILKELLQVADIDYVARAPRGREVEEMSTKQIMKALRNKMPKDQYVEMFGTNGKGPREDNRPDPFAQDEDVPSRPPESRPVAAAPSASFSPPPPPA